MTNSSAELYNAYYYQHGCGGEPYARTLGWLNFFDGIAGRLIENLAPQTVLDAGCAIGLLVETLRNRGVAAFGVDISEYAISQVSENIRPYCWQGSVTTPFPQKYDLIVCIEVLEHMPQAEAEMALANFCQHTDCVVFSSSPLDYKETTHFNVQPPEYWAEQFARHGFVRDVDFDANFITAWAVCFVRRPLRLPRIVRDYERRFWHNHKQTHDLRELAQEQRHQLEAREQQHQTLTQQIHLLEQNYQATRAEHATALALVQTLQAQLAQAQQALHTLQNQHVQLRNTHEALLAEQQALQQTLSWRFLQGLWHLTSRLAPVNSPQEKLLRTLINGLRHQLADLQAGRPTTYLGQFIQFSRQYGWLAAMQRGLALGRELLTQRQKRLQMQARALLTPPIHTFHPPTPPALAPLAAHTETTAIVVCVHNALADVQRCLEAIVRYTRMPYRLIIVDDGSDTPTQTYLAEFATTQGVTLLRNATAQGYTRAANQGLRATTEAYVVLLNSDTLVTPEWLDRLIACAAPPEVGLVGPLSNTASWQSVPEIFDAAGDWANNALPPGWEPATFARALAAQSARLYPRVAFLNGFCLLLKRAVLQQVGEFDEALFGPGYGEENDYCLRVAQAGWQLAVADDVYVYHAQSRSYSHERRRTLSEQANQRLIAKHGDRPISQGVQRTQTDRGLAGVRARVSQLAERHALLTAGQARWEGRRVLFLLPVAEAGGGANVVVQEAQAMRAMGVDVQLGNLAALQAAMAAAYPALDLPVVYVRHPNDFAALFSAYDAVVATTNQSVKWLTPTLPATQLPRRAHYIQDFEPWFYAPNSYEYQVAAQSYVASPDLVRLTKTEWNRQQVLQHAQTDCQVVGPSVDLECFRPRRRRDGDWPNRPLRITAMIRPSTPRRQAAFTMAVLGAVQRAAGNNIEVILFGCATEDPDFQKLPHQFAWRNAGVLTRPQLAALLNEVDIFADFSEFQAMGLTALEAMATGVAVIVPHRGGAEAFARPEQNCLMVDTSNQAACVQALQRLMQNTELRTQLQQQALRDSATFPPEKAAFNFLNALFPA